MNYKIVALDIDGTVLDSSGNMPVYISELARRLDRQGVSIVFCTGRRWKTAHKVIEKIENFHPAVICSGGALTKDAGSHKTLCTMPLPGNLVNNITETFAECGLIPFFLRDCPLAEPDLLISHTHRTTAERMAYVRKNSRYVLYHNGDPHLLYGLPLEVYSVDVRPKIEAAAAFFNGRYEGAARITAINQPSYGPDVWALEVHGPGTTKWHALERLMNDRGIKPGQVIAIGDDVNDIPMLKNAGLSFAMGNAVPEARAAADHVTESNDNEGVLVALESVFPNLNDLRAAG